MCLRTYVFMYVWYMKVCICSGFLASFTSSKSLFLIFSIRPLLFIHFCATAFWIPFISLNLDFPIFLSFFVTFNPALVWATCVANGVLKRVHFNNLFDSYFPTKIFVKKPVTPEQWKIMLGWVRKHSLNGRVWAHTKIIKFCGNKCVITIFYTSPFILKNKEQM